jgi:SH3-like domain-containing protein
MIFVRAALNVLFRRMSAFVAVAASVLAHGAFASLPASPAGEPFYAVTRSEKTNVRTGPNSRYPIRWIYKRKNWPVKVTAEFEGWYRIEDLYGEAGWAHRSLLSRRRYVVTDGKEITPVYKEPSESARKAFVMEPGVVARLEENGCAKGWCLVSVDGYDGWAQAGALWGAE